ncbi:hypothetical protein F2P81_006680 [Scophthalmus maximus]|uniref:Uncharacterized protein n=1 Tax=Scophthalmus maximus TaxID=52904 RepID=A0A6A4TF20_SCOMX|nr:hypothetical protein F2P81_006680 [Scophthalmus maximus]
MRSAGEPSAGTSMSSRLLNRFGPAEDRFQEDVVLWLHGSAILSVPVSISSVQQDAVDYWTGVISPSGEFVNPASWLRRVLQTTALFICEAVDVLILIHLKILNALTELRICSIKKAFSSGKGQRSEVRDVDHLVSFFRLSRTANELKEESCGDDSTQRRRVSSQSNFKLYVVKTNWWRGNRPSASCLLISGVSSRHRKCLAPDSASGSVSSPWQRFSDCTVSDEIWRSWRLRNQIC